MRYQGYGERRFFQPFTRLAGILKILPWRIEC
jgi:hypothetical protein